MKFTFENRVYVALLPGLSCLFFSACGAASEPRFVPPSPLGNAVEGPHAAPRKADADVGPSNRLASQSSPQSDVGPVTLETAVSRAVTRNRELMVAAEAVRMQVAHARQAGLYPNPELRIDAEDFLGSGTAKGVSGIQVTTAVSQPVELGGKRRRRQKFASEAERIAAWEYEHARVSLITEVKKAFFDLLAAQRKQIDAEDTVRITEDVLATFRSQMEAGKITAIEINNAEVALARARIQFSLAEREAAARRRALCTLWAETRCPPFEAEGAFAIAAALPDRETLIPLLEENPELAAARVQVALRQAEIDLEHARAAPDISFNVGYRWINDPGDSALVAGAAVPLPFGNRNQGAIAAAEISLIQAETHLEATRTRLLGTLMERMEMLSGAWTAADIFQREVLPKAEETLVAIREGNRLGRFGYLDILRAEETLFQVREETVAAIRQYLHASAEVEQLISRPLALSTETDTAATDAAEEKSPADSVVIPDTPEPKDVP